MVLGAKEEYVNYHQYKIISGTLKTIKSLILLPYGLRQHLRFREEIQREISSFVMTRPTSGSGTGSSEMCRD